MPPRQPTHSLYPNLPLLPPVPPLSFRISRVLHFGSASSSRQALLCLLPTNQPTRQPRASLMLLLQISGRLLGCLPAGTIGRCVFPSSSRVIFFLSLFLFPRPISFVPTTALRPLASLRDAYALSFPSSLPRACLHFILHHAPLLSFSFPEDTHSFVTIVGNGEEVDESMASALLRGSF